MEVCVLKQSRSAKRSHMNIFALPSLYSGYTILSHAGEVKMAARARPALLPLEDRRDFLLM